MASLPNEYSYLFSFDLTPVRLALASSNRDRINYVCISSGVLRTIRAVSGSYRYSVDDDPVESACVYLES
jgi:hypothetical protein